MTNRTFHVFGVGLGSDDVRYVGCTQRSIDEEKDEIICDIMKRGLESIGQWVRAGDGAQVCIFEIESASSIEEARDRVTYWCQCLNWLGLHVEGTASPGEA